MTVLLLGEAARYECLFRDSDAMVPHPEPPKSDLLGYGIRQTISKRWYASGGRWEDNPDCYWPVDYSDFRERHGLWDDPEQALRSLNRYFRRTEIALIEAVPFYESPPEDFEEVADVWTYPYRLYAGRAIRLK